MSNITLQRIDSQNKTKVIQLIREITGWGFAESQAAVDQVESGTPFTIQNIPTEQVSDIAAQFEGLGCVLIVCEVKQEFLPIFPADSVSGLNRQETLELLLEVKKIAKTLEDCDIEITELEGKIKAEQNKAEALRNRLTKPVSRKIYITTIIAAVIGTFIVPILMTVILGIVAYFVAFKKWGMPDLEEHQEENNIAAETHIREYVLPLQAKQKELTAVREEIMYGGKRVWALEVIGEDLFYSSCIDDLYDLVKSRRADNLKEALNKYDDEQYKAHMQEIQQAAQRAAEISAEEAKKQTEKLDNVAWNTFWTNWNTRQIKKKMRK